jgi:hypothetical protein
MTVAILATAAALLGFRHAAMLNQRKLITSTTLFGDSPT